MEVLFNFFAKIGLKILEGRDFTIDDTDSKQPMAIVSTGFARKYFGYDSPLGQRVRLFNPAQPQPGRTVVGVVPDTLMQGPFNQQTDETGFYVPLLGVPPAPQFCTIVVRPHAGQRAETLGPALSRAVARGADATRIFRLVMTQGAWPLVIGLILGVGTAALSTLNEDR